MLLKKPIKKPFAAQSRKISILANQATTQQGPWHISNQDFEPLIEQILDEETSLLSQKRSISKKGNSRALDRYGLVPF